jgi:hypothetical protein
MLGRCDANRSGLVTAIAAATPQMRNAHGLNSGCSKCTHN